MPSKSVWFATISVIICSVWLTGCASGILGSKDSKVKNPGTAGTTDKSRLAKPATPEDRASGSLAKKDAGETPGAASGKSLETFATPAKGAKAEKPTAERAPHGQSDLGKDIADSGDDKQRSGPSSSEALKSGASTRTSVAETSGDPPTAGKSVSDTSLKGDLPFKKHDHKKYTQKIKNKAIDKLNEEKDVTYARLCKDSTTDEWSLWIYKSQGKTYQFAAYSWDEVDQKWEESLKPNKQPMSGWRHHLKFTADGKQCEDLLREKRH